MTRLGRTIRRSILPCLFASAALALVACDSTPKQARKVEPPKAMLRDVPQPLRGTIGAEATFRGVEPTLISGLGIVVGLAGTGGADNLDQAVMATMERELARGGIGKGGIGSNYEGLEGVTPSQFLRSADVAVVIVEARVAPGTPEGSPFDVYVRTIPGSSVTSLEGGLLWTTDLRIGPAAIFGAYKTRKIAEARGPIFINPFSEPSVSSSGELQVTRTSGRILSGGRITDPLLIEMVLDNDSHARARSIVNSINTRFPRERGDDGAIARGRGSGGGSSTQSIALRVPRAYADRPSDFLQLVRHLRVDPSLPEEFARMYVETMKSEPALAESMRWCLQAIGKPAIPFLHPMYEYPEIGPRFACLEAGARLGDNRAVQPLITLAQSGPTGVRTEAIKLLGEMPSNPAINLSMRELVNAPDLEVRVAAYEAMRNRNDPLITQVPIGEDIRQPRFTLEIVPSNDPLVYITQQGEPRMVLFGGIDSSQARRGKYAGIPIIRPNLVSTWGDRFMMSAESATADTRIRWQDPRTQQTLTMKSPGDLAELIQMLAQKTTPENPKPGLAMTYSQVVGVVYELTRQNAVAAAFATEEDRLRAEIYEAAQGNTLADRPETEADAEAMKSASSVFRPEQPKALPSAEPTNPKSKVVPLKRKSAK